MLPTVLACRGKLRTICGPGGMVSHLALCPKPQLGILAVGRVLSLIFWMQMSVRCSSEQTLGLGSVLFHVMIKTLTFRAKEGLTVIFPMREFPKYAPV